MRRILISVLLVAACAETLGAVPNADAGGDTGATVNEVVSVISYMDQLATAKAGLTPAMIARVGGPGAAVVNLYGSSSGGLEYAPITSPHPTSQLQESPETQAVLTCAASLNPRTIAEAYGKTYSLHPLSRQLKADQEAQQPTTKVGFVIAGPPAADGLLTSIVR
jgi:hypothetical protein